MQVSGLKVKDRKDLADLLMKIDISAPEGFGRALHKQISTDLSTNKPLLNASLQETLPGGLINNLNLEVQGTPGFQGHEAIRISSNLGQILKVTPEQEHDILANLYAKIGNLNLELAHIELYDAIPAFSESDAPLLFGKLHGLIAPQNPKITQDAFFRVLDFTSIPAALDSRRVDVRQLLSIRKTPECREFRSWLSSVDQINDADLQRMIIGVKARATAFLASTPGKAVRFAVNTGIGLIPGVSWIVPTIQGVVDTFLVDKLLPSSGILTFINRSIPSVFV